MFSSTARQEKGQGLVEYTIILALVAIVVISVMRAVGPKVGDTFSTINTALESRGGYSMVYSDFDQGWEEYCAGLPSGTSVSSYYSESGSSAVVFAPDGSPPPSGYAYYDTFSC